jgi:uncharacterized phage protein (TIGR01671 family)
MDREIEFRGFDGTKWYYGDLEYNRKTNVARIHTYKEDGSYCRQYTVDPDTVGQFTGMTDKKDAKIYDGDILFVEFADKSGGYQLVGWNEKTASWGIMDAYSYQSIKEGCDFAEFKNYVLLAFLEKAIVFEVVGNIYNNPELLYIK